MTTLIEMLEELTEELYHYDSHIDWGGCCVMAGILGEKVKQHTLVRIAVKESMLATNTNNRCNPLHEARINTGNYKVSDWHKYGVTFGHVWLEFMHEGKWYGVDASDGVWEDENTGKFPDYLSVKEAQALGADAEGWNTSFNRNNIPGLQAIVDRHFDKFSMENAA
jgi:hypothetical protein